MNEYYDFDSKDMKWQRFVRLGERIADGDLDAQESRWMNREYAKLARELVPEIKQAYEKKRKHKAAHTDEQIQKLIKDRTTPCCGVAFRQSRKGSKICYCSKCDKRYSATSKKK